MFEFVNATLVKQNFTIVIGHLTNSALNLTKLRVM